MNDCYECMVIARDTAEGFTFSKCQTCIDNDEARADDKAWNLHEDDRLGEGPCLSYDTTDAPSASDWTASETYIKPPTKRAIMIEKWKDESMHLIELAVKFIDTDEPVTRSEFLPPIVQLNDGGVYEEYFGNYKICANEHEKSSAPGATYSHHDSSMTAKTVTNH